MSVTKWKWVTDRGPDPVGVDREKLLNEIKNRLLHKHDELLFEKGREQMQFLSTRFSFGDYR